MSSAKSTRSVAKAAAVTPQLSRSFLSPDECRSDGLLLEMIVEDYLAPTTPYEKWLSANVSNIEREIHIIKDRKNAILSAATRAALSALLSRRYDEADIAVLGEPDDVACRWVYGDDATREHTKAALKSVGIIVAEVGSEAYLDRSQIVGDLSREAGQLENRRRKLLQDYESVKSLRILNTARAVNED